MANFKGDTQAINATIHPVSQTAHASTQAPSVDGRDINYNLLYENSLHSGWACMPESRANTRILAHGIFTLYKSQSDITKADFLQNINSVTPVVVRFATLSSVRSEQDCLRDPRGFAVRFFTEEGHFDLVGSNIPVLYGQQNTHLADVFYSAAAGSVRQSVASARDAFWNFVSLAPESMHATLWAMSDHALPRSFATMPGFGVHSFRFVNAQGQVSWVKFHWKPVLGAHSQVWDEAVKLSAKDADFHRRQLWELIELGQYPEWELGVQVLQDEDCDRYAAELQDVTKLIPESEVPVEIIGKLTLNKNPERHFSDLPRMNFHPQNLVPGIELDDESLHSLFEPDSQGEHYAQAALFWRSQSEWEQDHLVEAFCIELAKVTTPDIRERMVSHLVHIDEVLALRVAKGLGITLSSVVVAAAEVESVSDMTLDMNSVEPALSLLHQRKNTLTGRCVAVLVANGFERERLEVLRAHLAAEGASVKLISSRLGIVSCSDGQAMQVDHSLATVGSVMFDAVYIPGGARSLEALCKDANAILFVKEAYKHGKAIAATNEGGMLITRAARSSVMSDVFKGPGVFTSGPATPTEDFVSSFINAVAQHRFNERPDMNAIVA